MLLGVKGRDLALITDRLADLLPPTSYFCHERFQLAFCYINFLFYFYLLQAVDNCSLVVQIFFSSFSHKSCGENVGNYM